MSAKMPRRPLGATGLTVSLLGLGTVKFGRRTGVRYPHPFELPDDDRAGRLLDHARALGVNLLDTAPAYGEAEARLGRLLAGRRSDFVLCSKAGETWDGERSRFDFSGPAVTASVHGSLRRLRTDHLDCVLIHSDGRDAEIVRDGAALAALEALRDRGDIRSFGLSAKSARGARAALGRVDVLMITLAPDDPDECTLAREAARQGCGILVKKALDSGHATAPAVALARLGACDAVSSVVVGTLDEAHLTANATALARADD